MKTPILGFISFMGLLLISLAAVGQEAEITTLKVVACRWPAGWFCVVAA